MRGPAKVKKLSRSRVFDYALFSAVVLTIVVVVRYTTALPYIDRVRFGHWMWQEEWSELGDVLWNLPEAYSLLCVIEDGDCRVEAYREVFVGLEEIELSQELRSHVHDLARAGRLYLLERADASVQNAMHDVDKLDRVFSVYLVSPRPGYRHDEACDDQFRRENEGIRSLSNLPLRGRAGIGSS